MEKTASSPYGQREQATVHPFDLTDTERMALSWMFHSKHPESLWDEFRDGKPGYGIPYASEAPEDKRKHHEMVYIGHRVGGLMEALYSLARFDLAEQFHLTQYERTFGAETLRLVEVEEVRKDYAPDEGKWGTSWTVIHYPEGSTQEEEGREAEVMQHLGYKYKGWGYGAGWNYRLTDPGREALANLNRHIPHCCDGVVQLPCVCSYKSFCAEHGGGCHGSHD